jgi:hypothetical protein
VSRPQGVRDRARSAAATVAIATAATVAPLPVAACNFHDGASLGVGMLNLAYPNALHVRGAVWLAQQDGTLAGPVAHPDASDRLATWQRFRETLVSLEALRTRLSLARDNRPVPSFSVVLIGPMLWTRFDGSVAAMTMSPHVEGPGRDDVVIVTDAPVLAALAAGRLTSEAARARGLIRLYGPPGLVAGVSAIVDRSTRSDRITARQGSAR